jgi:ABC-2 type transport system ATP-binding protein
VRRDEILLRVENLYKAYRQVVAVKGLSFEVHAGEIVGLLGPNGAGKTTVLRSICGLLHLNAGRIEVGGYNLLTQEEEAKRLLAYVPEVPNPFDMLTVWEHLHFIARAYGQTEKVEERARQLLERFDLAAKAHDLVATLSKGMKQKLALACAFLHNARVFLLDEPLIGIDPKGARELKNLLLEAREQGCGILVSTHLLDTAERLCDRVIILQRGVKVAEGTLAELKRRAHTEGDVTLEDVFLSLTETDVEHEGPPLPS